MELKNYSNLLEIRLLKKWSIDRFYSLNKKETVILGHPGEIDRALQWSKVQRIARVDV